MRSNYQIAASIIIIFAVVLGFMLYIGEDVIGLSSTDTTDFISISPAIFVVLVAFYGVSQSEGFMRAGSVTGLGLGLAYLIYLMDQADLLIPQTGMTASDIELVIIVLFAVLGVGVSFIE